MTACRHGSRRGIALVATLIACGVLTTVTVVVAGSAIGARRSEDARRLQSARIAAVDASRSLIAAWLAGDAETTVLALDVLEPRVLVCDVLLPGTGESPVQLQIAAFDALGMLPVSSVQPGSPLAGLLPEPIRVCLEQLPDAAGPPLGPDCFDPTEVRGEDGRVFPPSSGLKTARGFRGRPAIASHVSFDSTQTGLNIRTAPWRLVVGVAKASGRDGLESIRLARDAGEIPLLPAATRRETPERLQLTTTSDRWAFRIDVKTRGQSAGVWSVWARGRQGWQEVQRVRITD